MFRSLAARVVMLACCCLSHRGTIDRAAGPPPGARARHSTSYPRRPSAMIFADGPLGQPSRPAGSGGGPGGLGDSRAFTAAEGSGMATPRIDELTVRARAGVSSLDPTSAGYALQRLVPPDGVFRPARTRRESPRLVRFAPRHDRKNRYRFSEVWVDKWRRESIPSDHVDWAPDPLCLGNRNAGVMESRSIGRGCRWVLSDCGPRGDRIAAGRWAQQVPSQTPFGGSPRCGHRAGGAESLTAHDRRDRSTLS